MELKRSETNNAVIVKLANVRPHPNADRMKLATVLGTTVIVGLDAQEGDIGVYFDSNIRLSHSLLHNNNLYSNSEMNADTNKKGYFGKNGKVRTIKLRGELSDGFFAELGILAYIFGVEEAHDNWAFEVGDEFTHINGTEICTKYIVPTRGGGPGHKKSIFGIKSKMFHRHWDTKPLMRNLDLIPKGALCYLEEKVHGTSGRTGHVLCPTNRPWWKVWKPKETWQILSGTRNVNQINYHISAVRKDVEKRIAPHLHKGEQVYYEIYGSDANGREIQSGFPYGCRAGEYRVLLYRVTITTADGHCIDLSRKQVYARAEELGLEHPTLLGQCSGTDAEQCTSYLCEGKSKIDAGTLLEGIVVWFEDSHGRWTCLKLKSPEFLLLDSRNKDKGIGDVEDEN
jgi:hypothetical protein